MCRLFIWMVVCRFMPHLITHLSSLLVLFWFDFWFFHSSTERSCLGVLFCISSLFFFLGCKWTGSTSLCFLPNSELRLCLGSQVCLHSSSSWTWCLSLYQHSALLHILIHVYFVPIIPFCSLMYSSPFPIFSPSLCLNLFLLFHLFHLFLFSPHPSCSVPSILPHAGGESAVPTEQHRGGGQRHVPALCQPSHCISLWGRHLGEEAVAPDRTWSKTHVQGKAGETWWVCEVG